MDNRGFEAITKELIDHLGKAMRHREELLSGLSLEEREIVNKACMKLVENLWGDNTNG